MYNTQGRVFYRVSKHSDVHRPREILMSTETQLWVVEKNILNHPGAPNENIVQNYLNIAFLNVF